jgi:hypothetical protein
MPTTVVPAPDAAALAVTLLPEVTTDSPAERAWVWTERADDPLTGKAFRDPGADSTCTEAYASLCRTGQLLPGIRALEKSILSALSYEERAYLLDLLAKILTRAAEVATDQPEPIAGQRIHHARLGGVPQHS